MVENIGKQSCDSRDLPHVTVPEGNYLISKRLGTIRSRVAMERDCALDLPE